MGYAEASGLPAIYGLYATIVPLIAYAVFGPSRIMVLGPDSTLAAVIAALILPLAAGSVERAVALAGTAQLAVVGSLPHGLPAFRFPQVTLDDITHLLPGALIISLLSFADTSVLSRSLARRGGYRVNQNQEMLALGVANLAAGLFQGFSISSSASRTPVAESAGARTQVTGLVGALAIALLLLFAPNLLRDLPSAALGAVVVAACLSFADLPAMWRLLRLRRMEFALFVSSFLGVAFVGVIEGIFITVALAMVVLVWNAWHRYFAVLARVDGIKGFHDVSRHPDARPVPGLVLFRWDAQLFFANAEIFREQVNNAVAMAAKPVRRVVVAADAITDIDITAADALTALYLELQQLGIELWFAGLKGLAMDRLRHYGPLAVIGEDIFAPTVGRAVNLYREKYPVDWKDWDEI